MERKLAAILSADVQGYSRLMGENEVATITTLTAYRTVMTTLIQHHHGRVVDSPGDNLLAEFASAVEAVQAAVAMQHELRARNTALPEQRQMRYRIGLNVRDVMAEGERLYGDGVNIAARIESLAEGGGISISGTVYDQVKNKLTLHYEEQGVQQVKNIAEPVRVYRIRVEESSSRQVASPEPRRAGIARRKWALGAVSSLLLVTGLTVTVWYLFHSPLSTQHSVLGTEEAQPPLPLPDKPSIVVLPFTNMSNDPSQDYFSDGLTEDITTDLSRLSSLFVISRNTAFFYKGKAVKLPDLSKELGVQYVLEGSVRRADGHVRVTTQLIDATQDRHLWAERYDRPLKDIFALQDEIVQTIVTTLKLQLTLWEQGILVRKTTDNVEAYDAYLRGQESFGRAYQEMKKEANVRARQMYEKAIELDPQYAEAYARLAMTYWIEWFYQWTKDRAHSLDRAFELAQRAVALNDPLSLPHQILGTTYVWKRQHDHALVEAERAIALDPNDAEGYMQLGNILAFAGRPEEGIGLFEKTMRLNPRYPSLYLMNLGFAYRMAGRHEEAIAPLKKVLTRNPNFVPAHLNLAICYAELGRLEEAQAEVAACYRINPGFSPEVFKHFLPYKNTADIERFLDGLRKAGLK